MVINAGVHMEQEMLVAMTGDFVSTMLVCGFIPGFMLCTFLHLLGYGIFKSLTLLNIRN